QGPSVGPCLRCGLGAWRATLPRRFPMPRTHTLPLLSAFGLLLLPAAACADGPGPAPAAPGVAGAFFPQSAARAVSPRGDFTARVGSDLAVHDAATGRLVRQLAQGSHYVAVTFSADGRTLAAGDSYGTVELWSTATWGRSAELKGTGEGILCLAYSP